MTTDTTVCITCDENITDPHGCSPNHAHLYGSEPFWLQIQRTPSDICRDCGTPVGEPHHLPGCVVARCRVCDDQAMFCGHMP